jgi:hypothetical protein
MSFSMNINDLAVLFSRKERPDFEEVILCIAKEVIKLRDRCEKLEKIIKLNSEEDIERSKII